MNSIWRRLWVLCLWVLCLEWPVAAHVGNPNTVFEGRAGTYPLRVLIQAPPVVPGLALIDIRVLEGEVDRVEVLPIHWRTGRDGAPTPDVAQKIEGEAGRFHAELWLMVQGAYSIDISVKGSNGVGTIKVPVNSLALTAMGMPRYLGWILAALGLGLAALLIGTLRAGAREASLLEGEPLSAARIRAGRLATMVGCLVTVGLVVGGARWWNSEDAHYRAKGMFRPTPNRVELATDPERGTTLRLTLIGKGFDATQPLIPEHGHLVHLFLVRDSEPAVLVHLHPRPVEGLVFESQLPALREGVYRVFADITRGSGLSETVTNRIEVLPVAASVKSFASTDVEDSWGEPGLATDGKGRTLASGHTVRWLVPETWMADDPVVAEFEFREPNGKLAQLQPYMGMLGHAVIVSDDGTVFSHVHPAGTVSMAAQRQFLKRDGDNVDKAMADANCGDLTVLPANVVEALGSTGRVRFPYAFPKAGSYTIWVQAKIDGSIRTAAFPLQVKPGKSRGWNPYQP